MCEQLLSTWVVPAVIAGSMAFKLPFAPLPNARGHVTQRHLMHAGLRFNQTAIAVITLLFLFGVAG